MSAQRAAGLTSVLLLVGLSAMSLAAPPEAPISASVAALFVGQQKIVEGTVDSAQRDGNVVRLRLGTTPQALTVSLVVGLLSDFPPDPERYYLGKTVRVAGPIESFRGAPEMVVRDAANIRLMSAAASASERPEAGKAGTADAPSLREQVERLTEHVRTLEERVQQLEHPTSR